jgi:hypothetical protein
LWKSHVWSAAIPRCRRESAEYENPRYLFMRDSDGGKQLG